jgi:hypothetical protein
MSRHSRAVVNSDASTYYPSIEWKVEIILREKKFYHSGHAFARLWLQQTESQKLTAAFEESKDIHKPEYGLGKFTHPDYQWLDPRVTKSVKRCLDRVFTPGRKFPTSSD